MNFIRCCYHQFQTVFSAGKTFDDTLQQENRIIIVGGTRTPLGKALISLFLSLDCNVYNIDIIDYDFRIDNRCLLGRYNFIQTDFSNSDAIFERFNSEYELEIPTYFINTLGLVTILLSLRLFPHDLEKAYTELETTLTASLLAMKAYLRSIEKRNARLLENEVYYIVNVVPANDGILGNAVTQIHDGVLSEVNNVPAGLVSQFLAHKQVKMLLVKNQLINKNEQEQAAFKLLALLKLGYYGQVSINRGGLKQFSTYLKNST